MAFPVAFYREQDGGHWMWQENTVDSFLQVRAR